MSDLFLQSILDLLLSAGQFFLLWSPFLLAFLLWETYLYYIRAKWLKENIAVLLEIKLPREVFKSPLAMELVITALHQASSGTLIDQYIKGRTPASFSLEITSIAGKIHFYIWTPKFFQNIVESAIYAQYPEAEVYAVEDYTKAVDFGNQGSVWELRGVEFKFTEADSYPIKTYVDYGLDKDPKEEFKIDPITSFLEFIGSIEATHQIWSQLIITPAPKSWKDSVQKELDKLLKRDKPKKEGDMSWGEFALSSGEREKVKAVEKSLAKLAFNSGLRVLYLSRDDTVRIPIFVGIMTNYKQFGAQNLNSFKPLMTAGLDYPWQDPFGFRVPRIRRKFFQNYVYRSYHYPPASKKPMVMTTEELATLFHIPGQVATTPTLERIPSKRGEPPVNLPV
ncbi:MAG: hypothetical protein COX02_01375 [Candidatus Vogelbacteria bacterium CG22_combo_CG10-13_8_21_14_all_37_9]|uniref:DUF8128 domain-containing protein n=1 Tax=Candidatus Vogelbacteria bacterium CG22_combo_CG10-13_8_21_14_all_37_9 TaxID=1975046 RepID=A0A2H0BKP0_9BACT|nr:MAG: hypothetical protein BK005_01540 [bacterium CG10_37_50]PIP58245.1 MAG: hypothetical protein COX02_01375 [Candidatus Vogelbacteria bacterium CG22_combo_CG10-13_8_21_14_all_37_9]